MRPLTKPLLLPGAGGDVLAYFIECALGIRARAASESQ